MPLKDKEKPVGILRRSEARMAAVKALYAMEISAGEDEADNPWIITLDIMSAYDSGDVDHHFAVLPEAKFLEKIIAGVIEHKAAIDTIIMRNLSENWTMGRMGHVMVAVLRAAVFELSSSQKLPFKVIINEYVNIAHGFFNDKDCSFVNGILDKIAREVRE